jgi:hypothetical protein
MKHLQHIRDTMTREHFAPFTYYGLKFQPTLVRRLHADIETCMDGHGLKYAMLNTYTPLKITTPEDRNNN